MKYRAMTKSQLAALAGVSTRTFATWLRPHRTRLRTLGVCDTAKVLTPAAVRYLCEIFVINTE